MKKQTDIIIGNILGSNVFNILMIIGATAVIKPISQESIVPQILSLDIWVMLGVAIAFSLILLTYKKITKPIGFIFVLAYILYIGLIYGLYLSDDIAIITG
jgi:cation:H+ antiporter